MGRLQSSWKSLWLRIASHSNSNWLGSLARTTAFSSHFRREFNVLTTGVAFGLFLAVTELLVELSRSEWAMHKLIRYPFFVWDYGSVVLYLAILLAGVVAVPLNRDRNTPFLSETSCGQSLWFANALAIASWILFDAARFLYSRQPIEQAAPMHLPIIASIV